MKKALFLISIAFIIIAVVIVYWKSVSYFIPTLGDRGIFGDSFGALNCFFSGLALLGVVCALYIQQQQIKEMQKTFRLQYQPVLQLKAIKFVVDKPSIYRGPMHPICFALSRYHMIYELQNVSDTPAIDAVVFSTLISISNSSKEIISTAGDHFPLVIKNSVEKESQMYVPQEKPYITFFEALMDKDATRIPTVKVKILYKNLMGGCFLIEKSFHILLRNESNDLVHWQNEISSFPSVFKSEIRRLKDLENEPSRNNEYFAEIKSKYVKEIGGPDQIDLAIDFIPGAHLAKNIIEDEYNKFIKETSLPRRTFADSKCIIR